VACVHVRPQQKTIALLIACALAQTKPAAQPRAHVFHGMVQSVDTGAHTVTVINDNIPGWMASMTMSYRVQSPKVLSMLKASDRITATVYDGDVGHLYGVHVDDAVRASAQSSLPPLSYVCPSAGEEGVIEDKPGVCPKSGRALIPIRLMIAYSCLRGPRFLQRTPGTCTYDKSPLVPVTASVFWTCASEPSKRYLSPGTCGAITRRQEFEIRPHGDHNPRHGGISVFMSEDLRHHLEATFVTPGLFRVYFYDEYTRPIRASTFTARVSIADENAKEIAPSVALAWQRAGAGNLMEARIGNMPAPTSSAPLNFKLHVGVASAARDWVTDHRFAAYSKEPPRLRAVGDVDPLTASLPFTMKQDALPSTSAALLTLLAERTTSLESVVKDGNLTAAWFPAIGSKDIALELQGRHLEELSESRRAEMASATRRLTLTAWQIDAAGDLGNRDRLIELTREFTLAAEEIQSLYAASK
jgi:Cu/Ag efflux protein CusF